MFNPNDSDIRKVFVCSETTVEPPLVLVRWFDRSQTEWWARPDEIPPRVPVAEARTAFPGSSIEGTDGS